MSLAARALSAIHLRRWGKGGETGGEALRVEQCYVCSREFKGRTDAHAALACYSHLVEEHIEDEIKSGRMKQDDLRDVENILRKLQAYIEMQQTDSDACAATPCKILTLVAFTCLVVYILHRALHGKAR